MRKTIIMVLLSGFVLAGCDTIGESAGLGAAIGAGVAGATGGDMVTGALIGGAVGAGCHATNTC
ncbi:MAG: hypothetical protein JKY31_08995 [Rhodobacteraceae bacterium]|nr:hypothetical protein [Paracoccaceae bacterium]